MITRHALPVAAAPVVTLAGAYTPLLVGNVVLVEVVFGVPGAFGEIPDDIDAGDFEVLQGLLIVGALLVVVMNLLADLVVWLLDPRVRGG